MRRFRLKLYAPKGPALDGRTRLWGVFPIVANGRTHPVPTIVAARSERAMDLLKKKLHRERHGRTAAIDCSARPGMTLQAVGRRAIERARRVPPGFDH